jgi:hypothetical protein
VAACSSSSSPTRALGDTCGAGIGSCTRDRACWQGRCHDRCKTANDCYASAACVLTSIPEGANAPPCGLEPGKPCQRVCRQERVPCASNADCPASLVCAPDKKCHVECSSEADCGGEERCVKRACSFEDEAPPADSGAPPADSGAPPADSGAE